MTKYEFVEKVSEYTDREYGMKISIGKYKQYEMISGRVGTRMFRDCNFEYYFGHLPFEEGVYEFVNETIEKFNLEKRGSM